MQTAQKKPIGEGLTDYGHRMQSFEGLTKEGMLDILCSKPWDGDRRRMKNRSKAQLVSTYALGICFEYDQDGCKK